MTTSNPSDPVALERLLALIGEALALSDLQQLHATGIALDSARLSVEEALDQAGGERRGSDREWLQRSEIAAGRG